VNVVIRLTVPVVQKYHCSGIVEQITYSFLRGITMRLRFLLHLILSIGCVSALVPMAWAAAPHLAHQVVTPTAPKPTTTPTTAPTVDDDDADELEEEETDAGTQ
jgi:Na+-transporting methylmalonyl-CoA/oxaloacetate decarboxylase gamma subunit